MDHTGSGVAYYDLAAGRLLSRRAGRAAWSLNPYRGCEFGCGYCYARAGHVFLGAGAGAAFEQKIYVKRRAGEALERRLRRSDLAGQEIAIGTVTDPYQPAELRYGVTRALLAVLRRAEGLRLSVTTRSPLVLRDLDLLAELDQRHTVTVEVTLTCVDPELARRLEPGSPEPEERLRALAGLAARGLETRLLAAPLMPGITDGEATLRPLLEAARRRGAWDVEAAPLVLRGAVRARFRSWLAAEFPSLADRYRKLYRRAALGRRDREAVMSTFRRLRLQTGFPRPRPGRG